MKKLILSVLLVAMSISQASYLSIGESGEILPADKNYQVGLAPQLITNNDTGANIGAFLDAAWTDSLSSRFTLGVGVVDFYSGASLKYIPFPDVAQQPAIGLKASLWYAREETENITTVQIAPMVSKKFESADYGMLIPYTALGVSFYELGGDSKTGTQFFIGTDWKAPALPEYNLTAEIAMDLEDSTSHVSFFISLPFSEKSGF